MEFSEENVRIPFEQKELDGVLTVPADVSAGHCTAVVLTHGAGGDMHTKQLESLARALARSGVLCLRFTCRALNFLYRIRAYSAVVEYLKTHERYAPNSLFLGGRSMGARTAVAVCKCICDIQKDAVQGVLCLSFPLNVPGKPQTYVERSSGLLALSQTSVLFVSGTADNMCQQNLLQNIIHVMKSPSAVHWVKDANHGLTVRGRTEESVQEEVNSQIIAWVLQHKRNASL
ncbi:testis-expressed protein 30 isoform X1 [Onychostoma macrolepis]|uniref:testis-expressed protein 30 isoform X1 n=2 Tax=Onychostoma macrolepis TaxID=369639 RepID=UPI00272CFEBF|nr:testis-expressed protein 30 isoform X1 [Onychostoma macrolepis]